MSDENKCSCCTCGYEWQRGKNGSHSCSQVLLNRVNRMKWLLRHVMQDMPARRDWLNPDYETELREFIKEPD